MTSRRTFVRLSAALGSGALLPRWAWAGRLGGKVFTPGTLDGYAQGLLSRASLEKYVGTLFMAFLEDNQAAYMHLHSVKVAEPAATKKAVPASIEAVPVTKKPATPEPFEFYTATFLTGGGAIPQDTYVLDHARLGRNAVFLVPGVDKQGRNTAIATFSATA